MQAPAAPPTPHHLDRRRTSPDRPDRLRPTRHAGPGLLVAVLAGLLAATFLVGPVPGAAAQSTTTTAAPAGGASRTATTPVTVAAAALTTPTTVANVAVPTPDIIPKPNSGREPRDPGDRGGWWQESLFFLICGAIVLIGLLVWRDSRRQRRRQGRLPAPSRS